MAITIIATPGAANANSYVSKAEASAVGGYWETRLFKTNWTSATDADKKVALVWATRLLDDWVDWVGSKVDDRDEQALRWPRYGATDVDGDSFESDEIPPFLKDATAELAGHLLGLDSDPTAPPDTQGFSKLKVGSLELEVDKRDRDEYTLIPDSVVAIIEPYGRIRSRGGPSVANVVRT